MRPLAFLSYILILSSIFAQDLSIENLEKEYMAFNYAEVVTLAEKMLSEKTFSSSELIRIYEMKGIAHFSLGNEEKAREAFELLLKKDQNYSMNPDRISPKIISFFNEIKVEYFSELEEERPLIDSLRVMKENLLSDHQNYRTAVVKNIVLPGWGQFQLGNSTKGVIYSILSVAATTSTIISIADVNKKEKDYLNETNKSLIESKYEEYNSAYKTRNLLLGTTVLIWLASQIDILFFTDIQLNQSPPAGGNQFNFPQNFQLNLTFPLN